METKARHRLFTVACLLFAVVLLSATRSYAGGVTLIAHGHNSDADGWVTAMGEAIVNHDLFPGTNSSTYRLSVTFSGSNYQVSQSRISGVNPTNSDSGEILLLVDWSSLANNSHSTFQVAAAVAAQLTNASFIPEFGRPLTELPLHFIGHSRGGSLNSEISKLLGASGIWVDHMTTLDPHPLNNDGFDDSPLTIVDAPARIYENVLFADNYWQQLNALINGKSVTGAYNRQLTSLNGGYSGVGSSHSDVHLWYHGTIDRLQTPTSDGEATLTSTERQNWFATAELSGAATGFAWSLIGQSNRLSSFEPAGSGNGMIKQGFNQKWDLGAGTASNRESLPANNGAWPNLIRFNITGTNAINAGDSTSLKFYFQHGQSAATSVEVRLFLDSDFNPYNGTTLEIAQTNRQSTGTAAMGNQTLTYTSNPTNTPPGIYSVLAQISSGGRTRYLYAPELLTVMPSRLPLRLATKPFAGSFQFTVQGFTGQTFTLESSTNLTSWTAISTNTLTATTLELLDASASAQPQRFFRTRLE